MKDKNTYQIFNNYCLRTPLFPYSNYLKIIEKDKILDDDFKQLLTNQIFREALFLASPELLEQIEKWEISNLQDADKIEKLQITILKYYTRMSTRCTPFGLFASCSIGHFKNETIIELNDIKNYKRITRFDTTFLNSLFQKLLKQESIKNKLLFYPNTSIYKIGNLFRYVEYIIKNKKRAYSLEGIKYSDYLELILKKAKEGKKISELANLIIDEEITFKEAKEFIEELINNQILVSELEITVTGADYYTCLIERIEKITEAQQTYKQLKKLKISLKNLDTTFGNPLFNYKSIKDNTTALVPDSETKYLFQTDIFSSTNKNTLSSIIQKQLRNVLILFNKMTPPLENNYLIDFKRKFLKRFEESEVPLNLVLDTETGIGYADKSDDTNELLNNLLTPTIQKRYERVIWTDVDTILQQKLVEATRNKQYSINLTEEDFKDLPTTWNDLPDTFSSIIEVFKSEENHQIYINSAGGSSAVNLLGRFSSGNEQLLKHVDEIIRAEDEINNDTVLAEIVHLPEVRTGNILQRPSFRKHEIPYLGASSIKNENQIPLEDILISVKNDRIVLRSKQLNKEILPRLGNAHNYKRNSLPIYHFLCELQTQNKRPSIGFSWNSLLKRQPYLPRVEFKNFILSKARWNIKVLEFKEICKKEKLLVAIKKWQKAQMIPNFVELVDGDNKLLISLINENSVKMLLHTIKNRTQFILEEFLFTDKEIVKNEKENSFSNQFVISFYNKERLKAIKNESPR
ncbi:lantibiotic dehydratase family protein [Tenacibaculum ovolyticum]|uniref:lantibiotic dehydratase family protein n=1 Tax=Tenacibaculum ovolyticum TaxID=104270 RepID=UPI0007ED8AC9|nr:lantibiotic dehydratase family protein [Tenacibaculum ovolyticum]